MNELEKKAKPILTVGQLRALLDGVDDSSEVLVMNERFQQVKGVLAKSKEVKTFLILMKL